MESYLRQSQPCTGAKVGVDGIDKCKPVFREIDVLNTGFTCRSH